MTLHKTIERVLIGLGERHEVEVDSDEVRARALPLIKSGLERSPLLPRAVFNEDFDDLDFRTDITDGTIKRVDRARRFVGDLGEILLIDATWRLEFRLLYQERPASDETLWVRPRRAGRDGGGFRSTSDSQNPRQQPGSSSPRS